MQTEALENRLGIFHEEFEFIVGGLRFDEFHELDFVELVLTDHAPRVAPCTARL